MMMKMIKIRDKIYRLLLVACLLCATAQAYPQVSEPAAWSSTPTMSDDVRPAYNFRSTSSYTPIVGTRSYMSDGSGPMASSPQRVKGWNPWGDDDEGDPEGDPMGQWGGTPAGEPWCLLLMAALMALALRRRHLRRAQSATHTPARE